MFRRKVCLLVAIFSFMPIAIHAAQMKDFAGTWVMRLGTRTIFVLRLTPDGETLRGSWDRPAKYSDTNNTFVNISSDVRKDSVSRVRLVDGVLHFAVVNANDSKDEDLYGMRLDGDRAVMAFDDLPADVVVAPWQFERSDAGARVASDWIPNRLYTLGDSDVPSAEMEAIFKEDQRVRVAAKVDWKAVTNTDADRREQTRKLLATGALHTGKDYEEAAFVFQHGSQPEDYLLAHTLAMVAVSKGDATAIWIAAATLDRYLEKIGQKQVFGTQYTSNAQHVWTQEPYNRDLISDALRLQLGVPSQAVQAEQLKIYQRQQ
jgi:hypothetical protein